MGTRQRVRLNDVDAKPTPRLRIIKPTSGPTLLDCIADQALFAPWFKDTATWAAWFTFLRALFALPMSAEQLALYQRCTGRNEAPTGAASEAWLVCGRRAGKSFILALVAVFLAAFHDYRQYLAPGEKGVVLIIASDRKQARVILRYIEALLTRVPMLSAMIDRTWAEGFELNNSVAIEVGTSSFRSVRGYTIVAALLDEAAFWTSDEYSANPDHEVVKAIKPAMSTIPNSMMLVASSPHAKRGILFDAHRLHYGKEHDPILVWQADTRSMNPSVPQSVIDDAYLSDPASASAEFGAQFRNDLAAYVTPEAIMQCVSEGIFERPRESGISYSAFVDMAGGSGKDSACLAIGYKDKKTEMSVVSCLREFRPPFSPDAVIQQMSAVLKSYGVTRMLGDKYGGDWCREPFKKFGIYFDNAADPKSTLYQNCLPLINSKRVDLLDHPKMISQFVALEVRTSRSGRLQIDSPPAAHEDLANVTAGLITNIGVRRYAYDASLNWV